MPEKFDFSKIEDQKRFETLPAEDKGEIKDEVEAEAAKIKNNNILTLEQEEMKNNLIKFLDWPDFDIEKAKEIKNRLPDSLSLEIIENYFIDHPDGYGREIREAFHLSKDFINSSRVLRAVKNRVIEWYVSENCIDQIPEFFERVGLEKESMVSILKFLMFQYLKSENNYSLRHINGIAELLKDYNAIVVLENPDIQQLMQERAICGLSEGNYIDVFKIKKQKIFNLPEKLIQSAAEKAIIIYIKSKKFEEVLKIKKLFSIPNDTLYRIMEKELIKCVSSGDYFSAIKIININIPELKLSDEVIQEVVKQELIKRLTSCTRSFMIIINTPELKPSNEILQSAEIQEAAEQGFIKYLSNGRIEGAIEIKDIFLANIQSAEIIEKIPEISEFLEKVKEISSDFYSQVLKSTDLLMELCRLQDRELSRRDRKKEFLKIIRENSFLTDAAAENPRYGSKLLVKYPQFDKLSKQNIEFFFNAKKEILAANPCIDPESLEFRQAMQEKLKGHKNNSAILEQLEKDGMNIEEWLNYSETQYFNLESGAGVLAFSETVSAPINRIKETLDSYAHTLKETLKQYRPELSAFKISIEDVKEMEEKIAVMRAELEKAKTDGNAGKAAGIERGIENLQKRMENVKTVGLWDKLLGDISAFQRLKNDAFGAQERLIKAEDELQEKLSGKMPSGRMIQELKQKINNVKEELRSKFGILERRMENFKNNLPKLLAPALGEERAGALIQEIEQNLAEQFSHYNTDRSTLANLFSERGDKEKSKMENQPMSIFVWARNPDIDLYQGNYSPCCICIDSEHMGAESTIADYNTDLGVHVVNIWDEVKSEPVTAAWCWIGKNEKGETALVVDNIESNTLYSANYSEQLTKELFSYLENYAKAIGVKKIVLGKANNDLPTSGELAKLKDDESKYEKAGGYNRPDGYFLEAEDKTVKILWWAQEKAEQPKERIEKAVKVEFQDLKIENLSEKDFAKIKHLERIIYQGTDLISGQTMIEDIKSGNGLEYSIIAAGKRPNAQKQEAIGYLAAVEDETNEGDACVYLEDIALLPEAQGQKIGWEMLKNLIGKLKEKAKKENEPVLLDMHLRETSQRFFEHYHDELERMDVKLIEEALVPDYYNEGDDALYKIYEIKAD